MPNGYNDDVDDNDSDTAAESSSTILMTTDDDDDDDDVVEDENSSCCRSGGSPLVFPRTTPTAAAAVSSSSSSKKRNITTTSSSTNMAIETADYYTYDDADDADVVECQKTNEHVLNFAFVSFVSFLLVQAVFAWLAHSQAMLADCEAMSVDALTYLFNLWAERAKQTLLLSSSSSSSSSSSTTTTTSQRKLQERQAYQCELYRLYLELIPPAISCCTLIGITMFTLRDAFATLLGQSSDDGNGNTANDETTEPPPPPQADVSVVIMMIFSSSNLLLDIINVTCFARSSALLGLPDVVRRHSVANATTATRTMGPAAAAIKATNPTSTIAATPMANEMTPLKLTVPSGGGVGTTDTDNNSTLPSGQQPRKAGNNNSRRSSSSCCTADDDQQYPLPPLAHPPQHRRRRHADLVNLNMCSAWTHVCADTMRSTAVLIAAAVSYLFPTSLSPVTSDAMAAVAVSFIIFGSLMPLLHCLVRTAFQIHYLRQNPPVSSSSTTTTSSYTLVAKCIAV